jgi:hypothetical protein
MGFLDSLLGSPAKPKLNKQSEASQFGQSFLMNDLNWNPNQGLPQQNVVGLTGRQQGLQSNIFNQANTGGQGFDLALDYARNTLAGGQGNQYAPASPVNQYAPVAPGQPAVNPYNPTGGPAAQLSSDVTRDPVADFVDPRTSDSFQGYRNEVNSLRDESNQRLSRQSQLGGTVGSTPSQGIAADNNRRYDDLIMREMGNLYNQERDRYSQEVSRQDSRFDNRREADLNRQFSSQQAGLNRQESAAGRFDNTQQNNLNRQENVTNRQFSANENALNRQENAAGRQFSANENALNRQQSAAGMAAGLDQQRFQQNLAADQAVIKEQVVEQMRNDAIYKQAYDELMFQYDVLAPKAKSLLNYTPGTSMQGGSQGLISQGLGIASAVTGIAGGISQMGANKAQSSFYNAAAGQF